MRYGDCNSSDLPVSLLVAESCNAGMDNKSIRKTNLVLLVRNSAGSDISKQALALGEKVAEFHLAHLLPGDDIPNPAEIGKYIKQLLAGFQGKRDRKPRGVGDQFARDLEGALNLGLGWMDARHDTEWAEAGITPNDITESAQTKPVAGVTLREDTTKYLSPLADATPAAAVHHVPLLTWEQCLMAHDNYDKLRHGPTYPIQGAPSGRLIALEMPDDSMQAPTGQSFPVGTTLFFNIDLPPDHGHYVLFKGPDGRPHFRRYVIDLGRRRLHPLNPRYEPIPAPSDPGAYLGVLVLAVLPIFRFGS